MHSQDSVSDSLEEYAANSPDSVPDWESLTLTGALGAEGLDNLAFLFGAVSLSLLLTDASLLSLASLEGLQNQWYHIRTNTVCVVIAIILAMVNNYSS